MVSSRTFYSRNVNKNSLPTLTDENQIELNYTEKGRDSETFPINNLSQKEKGNETSPTPTAGNSIKSQDKSPGKRHQTVNTKCNIKSLSLLLPALENKVCSGSGSRQRALLMFDDLISVQEYQVSQSLSPLLLLLHIRPSPQQNSHLLDLI